LLNLYTLWSYADIFNNMGTRKHTALRHQEGLFSYWINMILLVDYIYSKTHCSFFLKYQVAVLNNFVDKETYKDIIMWIILVE
jgi:hypothetical protein